MIPITMCHGVTEKLGIERFSEYFRIASELDFHSVDYCDIENWLNNNSSMPSRPIAFDFDHPVRSIYTQIFPIMRNYGFKGNLFINTEPMERMYSDGSYKDECRDYMTWDEINELVENGWCVGAHTHTHPDLYELAKEDTSGGLVAQELEKNDSILEEMLSIKPRYFAFTGISWSSIAEMEVMKRYKCGRLWIIGAHYKSDGKLLRYADLVGHSGADEIDGGPPTLARYITTDTPRYKLPSMELEGLIYNYDAYERYLATAFNEPANSQQMVIT